MLAAVLRSCGRWAAFAVFLALLPVIANVLGSVTRGESLRFVPILEHGELLLVSAAIVGASIAELIGPGRKVGLRVAVGVFGGLLVLTTSIWFADVAAAQRDGSQVDAEAIAWGSVVVFVLAFLVGVACIVAAEWSRR
jgi:hypothetical protein